MGQVLTNNTTAKTARQTSIDVLGGSPVWFDLEPNSFGKAGAEIKTTPRAPISKLRQDRKGTTTDLDAAYEYEEDLTISSFLRFAENFFFASGVNNDLTFRNAPAVSGGYTIPAATAAQAAKLQWVSASQKTLVYSRGYVTTANNGLKVLSADTAASGTTLAVAGNVAETPPTNAEVSVCGIRAEAGDLALAVSGTTGTLTSGNGAAASPINFTTIGLTVGQFIHVGGLTATNRFGATVGAGSNDSYGFARVRTIAAGTLTLDKMSSTLIASDGTDTGSAGAEVAVDLLFGRFFRNVSVDSAEFLKAFNQVELGYEDAYETDPPTPVANPDGFEYILNLLGNTLELKMPLTSKAVINFGFIGTDAEDPVDNTGRKTNAAASILPLFTEAFNTTADFMRLRIIDVDEAGLTTDLKDVTAKFNNNVSAEKVLARLGARFMNFGNFQVELEATALFTNPDVVARIRGNTTVSADWVLANDDGGLAFDIPSATIGGGAKEFPVNETVRIAIPLKAHVDPILGTSASVSVFPVLP